MPENYITEVTARLHGLAGPRAGNRDENELQKNHNCLDKIMIKFLVLNLLYCNNKKRFDREGYIIASGFLDSIGARSCFFHLNVNLTPIIQ